MSLQSGDDNNKEANDIDRPSSNIGSHERVVDREALVNWNGVSYPLTAVKNNARGAARRIPAEMISARH